MSTIGCCNYCGKKVKKLGLIGHKVVKLCGKIWHRKCFKCSNCQTLLSPESCKFTDDYPFCSKACVDSFVLKNANTVLSSPRDEDVDDENDASAYIENGLPLFTAEEKGDEDDDSYQSLTGRDCVYPTRKQCKESWKEVLIEHQEAIVKSADLHDVVLDHLLDHLMSKRCIQDDHYQLVKREQKVRCRMSKLLHFVSSEGFNTFNELCNAFENFGTDDKKQLADRLRHSLKEKEVLSDSEILQPECSDTRKQHPINLPSSIDIYSQASRSKVQLRSTKSEPQLIRVPNNYVSPYKKGEFHYQSTADESEKYTVIREWSLYVSQDKLNNNIEHDYESERIYGNNLRMFTEIPLNKGLLRWKFLAVESDAAAETDPDYQEPGETIPSIAIGCSYDPRDFPQLPGGFNLLHNAVIHCRPHAHEFNNPVLIAIVLPTQLQSASGVDRLSIYYSPTDTEEVPRWRMFNKKIGDQVGNAEFTEMNVDGKRANIAATCISTGEVILTLHHFCMFAVVIDQRIEENQKTLVRVLAKLRVCSKAYNVDVLVLVGCDDKSVTSEEQFVLETGYKKVGSAQMHMINIGGDVTVKLCEDNVHWMDDTTVMEPQLYIHQKIDIWAAMTKSTFSVQSLQAVANGVENHCSFNVEISQTGRRPLIVNVSKDLHELVPAGVALPHCRGSNCGCCRVEPYESTYEDEECLYLDISETQPSRQAEQTATETPSTNNLNLSGPPPLPPRQQRELWIRDDRSVNTSDTPQPVAGSMKSYSTIQKQKKS